ncbi:MAG: hypothetical protein WD872_01550 [Pirellulaceae bacterium]
MNAEIDRKIERALAAEDWKAARKHILRALQDDPQDHWLLTNLATTYYEERDYRAALDWSRKALILAPQCPIVLWDYAGSLDMLGREKEAIEVWRGLIDWGAAAIAADECGEGIRAARSLVNDCRYRIGCAQVDLGHREAATEMFEQYVANRGRSTPSIYSLDDVHARLAQLAKQPGAEPPRRARAVRS